MIDDKKNTRGIIVAKSSAQNCHNALAIFAPHKLARVKARQSVPHMGRRTGVSDPHRVPVLHTSRETVARQVLHTRDRSEYCTQVTDVIKTDICCNRLRIDAPNINLSQLWYSKQLKLHRPLPKIVKPYPCFFRQRTFFSAPAFAWSGSVRGRLLSSAIFTIFFLYHFFTIFSGK